MKKNKGDCQERRYSNSMINYPRIVLIFSLVSALRRVLAGDSRRYTVLPAYATFSHITMYSNNIVFTTLPALFVGEFLLGIALLLKARS
ncbi:MAG: hypothetical protein LBO67_08520 [Spirochaetaceae bacterium]|jgi:hypothetical protein|nr:hypothetical protein [Spirochaetaceae bacterium]